MRNTTQMNKKKCGTSNIGLIKCDNHIKRVSYLQYLDEKKPRGAKKTRLCPGNIMLLKQHLKGASGKLSNVWQKSIHGVSDMQEACLFQEWTDHD
jgi:hypothetical protein